MRHVGGQDGHIRHHIIRELRVTHGKTTGRDGRPLEEQETSELTFMLILERL